MDKITYKFRCGHHRRILEGAPQFSQVNHNLLEWEMDLSEMYCPAWDSRMSIPQLPEEEFDEEWKKCVDSWHLVETRTSVPDGATGASTQNDNQRDD
jgi:hypothetical protein